jgi:RimJ/RimL family protein N-acetyltransferase
VELRPPREDDATAWARWFDDLEVTVPLGDEAYVPTSEAGQAAAIAGMRADGMHVFTVVESASGAPIGRCLLFSVDAVNASAWVGIVMGEPGRWGRGEGSQALELLLGCAFELLNLHSVMLGVFAFNARAIRCYERLGFARVGVRRQARRIAGVWHDVVLMDLLAAEWRGGPVRARLQALTAGGEAARA